jgi:hypothetical protein
MPETYQKMPIRTISGPMAMKIDWQVSPAPPGRSPGWKGFIYTHTGGAHGNYMTDGRIYNTQTGERMRIGDLFLRQAPAAAGCACPEGV